MNFKSGKVDKKVNQPTLPNSKVVIHLDMLFD